MKTPAWMMAALLAVVLATPVHANEAMDGLSFKERREKIMNMSEQEREAFFAERKAKWQGMSREEKLKEIERRRTERIRMMEEHWNGLSDDEKIAHVEEKMKHMGKGKGGGWGDRPQCHKNKPEKGAAPSAPAKP